MGGGKVYKPEHFTNRHLSWLEFNQRVLDEAHADHPLLERLKFLCIVSTNLDEFFEIRVAGLKQQIQSANPSAITPDGLTPQQAFLAIRDRARKMVSDQSRVWNEELKPLLEKNNIRLCSISDLSATDKNWVGTYFEREVFPVLTPLAIAPSHPFPQLLNKSLNLIVSYLKPEQDDTHYGIVQVPRSLQPILLLPNRPEKIYDYLPLSSLIAEFADKLFSGDKITGVHEFRITRNSELYIDEEEASDILAFIEQELQHRNRGNAVRLEVQMDCPPQIKNYLLEHLGLSTDDLYEINGPLHIPILQPILNIPEPQLKDKPWLSVISPAFQSNTNYFDIIRHQDVLIHHPYENFSSVVEFVEKSAIDPQVLAIKMTLYRTSGDSPIIHALINAAHHDKSVTAVIELKARFDEANNIAWARRMEEAGVHVVYGPVGLKTHCKVLMVVRRDEDSIRHYVHLGTGNYHPSTARVYTDLGLFTSSKEITSEVAALFNMLTGLSETPNFQKLLVAPYNLASSLLNLIQNETRNAQNGKPARIFAKLNAIEDRKTIETLYEASSAGVKIDLIIRGICCLKPGLPGISENIRVFSIVDRFLEHSRIFYFENNGDPKVYLGSADWMGRNLYHRIEVVFPVENPQLKKRIIDQIIPTYLMDNQKSREISSDNTHKICTNSNEKCRCQEKFMKLTKEQSTAS
jgi:polyphosphate kinase